MIKQVDKKEILTHFRIFDALTPDQMQNLERHLKPITVPRHAYIFFQGEEAKSIYLLYKGSVKLGKTDGAGREAIKEVLHTYSILGSSILHGATVRLDFARVINKETHLLELTLDTLKYFMRINHHFSLNIIKLLSKKLSYLENRMATLMIHDARGRIIDFIKKTATEQGRKIGLETLIRHRLTQQEIANITGTSRQTVTQVLNQLKKSNLIHFNRKSILVRDMAKLA